MASCDVASSPSAMADETPSIQVTNEPDVLQHAIAKHQTFDLTQLSHEPGVVEFCQTQCFYLEEAKLVMQHVAQGLPVNSSHALVLHHYVPFLTNFHHYQAQQQYPDGDMAPGVSYLSAGVCLNHLLHTDAQVAAQDVILAPLFSLPPYSETRLIQCSLMMIHCRSCINEACNQDFCAGLKQVLAEGDCDNDDYRMCVQLDRHLRRNKDNPDDPVCSQVMKHIRQAEETQRRLQAQQAASLLTTMAKNTRSARSFSMPPKVDMARLEQEQQAPQPSSAVWQQANPMLGSYPGGLAANYVSNMSPGQHGPPSPASTATNAELEVPSSPRLSRGRSKAHSMPARPADTMDDADDE